MVLPFHVALIDNLLVSTVLQKSRSLSSYLTDTTANVQIRREMRGGQLEPSSLSLQIPGWQRAPH